MAKTRVTLFFSAKISILLILLLAQPTKAADPNYYWRTLTTAHFVITYPKGYESWAARTSVLAEKAYDVTTRIMGHHPHGKTHIVITDYTDLANGWATTYFRNTITVYAVSPDDVSELSDFDDWLWGLLLHEYTHILHMDTMGGLPRFINRIFGQIWIPNSLQPSWVLEGMAIYNETRFTLAGRNRSTYYDMILRTSVLEDRLQRLDEISSDPIVYPHGTIPYLYGSRFLWYLANRQGEDNLRFMSADYGNRAIPFAVQQSARMSFGRDLDVLYADFLKHLKQWAYETRNRVVSQGLVQGKRLVNQSENTFYPVFHPTDPHRLLYVGHDGHHPNAVRHIRMDTQGRVLSDTAWENSVVEAGPPAWDENNSAWFHQVEFSRWVHTRHDLFRVTPKGAQRLTYGARLTFPTIARKMRLAIRATSTGTHELVRVDTRGRVIDVLIPTTQRKRIYGVRISPDEQYATFSVMDRGQRDIELLHVASNTLQRITNDTAMDVTPTFSPDGRYLLFSSDRSGIFDIYAWDMREKRLFRVTRVLSGAFSPTVSADDRFLVYAGYTARGFTLFIMPFSPQRFLPSDDSWPQRAFSPWRETPYIHLFPDAPYQPWRHLAPQAWFLDYGFSETNRFTLSMMGFDPVQLHSWNTLSSYNPFTKEYAFNGNYTYDGWWFPMNVSLSFGRELRENARINRIWVEYPFSWYQVSCSTSIPVWQRFKRYASTFFSLTWSEGLVPKLFPPTRPDYPLPSLPTSFSHIGAAVGIWYRHIESSTYALDWENGESVTLTANPSWKLQNDSFWASFTLDTHVRRKLPWGNHTVLGLRLRAGTSVNASTPLFSVGGTQIDRGRFPPFWIDLQRNMVPGFPNLTDTGKHYWATNFALTFPLSWIGAGISTLPFFVRRVSAKVYGGLGEAFDTTTDWADPLLGLGAEIRFHLVAGYAGYMDLVLGVSKSLLPENDFLPYVQISSPLPEGVF